MNLVEYMRSNSANFSKDYNFIYRDNVEYYVNELNVVVNDVDDAFARWKKMLYPSAPLTENWEEEAKFYVLSFYLHNSKFIVKGHPFLLRNIETFENVSNNELRIATKLKFGVNDKGHVTFESRRRYIDELELVKDEGFIQLFELLNKEINSIVNKKKTDSSNIPADTRLARIASFFENLMILNDKYMPLYFSKIAPFAKDATNIRVMQNELNVFLYNDLISLEKRNLYSKQRKSYLLTYSMSILTAFRPYMHKLSYEYYVLNQ